MMKLLFPVPLLVVLLVLTQPQCHAQARPANARPAAPFFTTYTYLTYSILDKGTSPKPLSAKGVGGTLTLRPDGTYQKSLLLAANGTTQHFDQEGRFSLTPGRITFTHPDPSGTNRTDAGTFRLTGKLLTITLEGYPAGNQSIYTLRAQ
ncbi:hypothetical protein [Hymenobacter swuensis]|uniref:Lipocalin-like domain-containing protein n=1 Tax=Hymenobacter swuensis DY53 TaxID=1227739 RepID=W8F3L4_9BACT|nr:hypothetical protein [Hymenobacter swuensis]AHJ97186.1 hypothetical protein Hsw_1591 [Hymenobacter swuensis DY53]